MSGAKLARKNLMVDAEKLRELARRRGLNESATVRELIVHALAAEEVGEILRELQQRGGIDDVFEKLGQEEPDGGEAARPLVSVA